MHTHKTTSPRNTLQLNFVENPVKRGTSRLRRRVTRSFTPLPNDYQHTIPRLLRPLFLLLWEEGRGRPVARWQSYLAKKLGCSVPTVQRHSYALEALGKVAVGRRKVGPCKNGANVFSFPELSGFIVEEANITSDGLKERTLNTTTKAPRASAPSVSHARLRWEHNRAENHPPAMRTLYEQNAALMGENRTLRHRSRFAGHRERLKERLMVGAVWIDPQKPKEPLLSEEEAQIAVQKWWDEG